MALRLGRTLSEFLNTTTSREIAEMEAVLRLPELEPKLREQMKSQDDICAEQMAFFEELQRRQTT